jgi:hypothetical protein
MVSEDSAALRRAKRRLSNIGKDVSTPAETVALFRRRIPRIRVSEQLYFQREVQNLR